MSQSRLPGTPSLLRAINDRAALSYCWSVAADRAQLGELTGLSKVTASQLVERLEERQLVARSASWPAAVVQRQLYAWCPAVRT